MSDVRSFVERTIHLQFQRFMQLRPLVPVFAVIIIFTSIPLIERVSSASISALCSSFSKAFATSDGAPLLDTFCHILTRALSAASLRMRVHIHIPMQWRRMFERSPGSNDDDTHYPTSRAEARYWRIAGRYRRRLYGGNAPTSTPPYKPRTASREGTAIPLVTYYTPRLLPLYRDSIVGKRARGDAGVDAAQATWVSPKTFCKWHRMVFQDACHHPTLAQAAVQAKYYSNRDLGEIQRIARLLPDDQVFGHALHGARKAKRRVTKYNEMWKNWLENKGMDIVIVFE